MWGQLGGSHAPCPGRRLGPRQRQRESRATPLARRVGFGEWPRHLELANGFVDAKAKVGGQPAHDDDGVLGESGSARPESGRVGGSDGSPGVRRVRASLIRPLGRWKQVVVFVLTWEVASGERRVGRVTDREPARARGAGVRASAGGGEGVVLAALLVYAHGGGVVGRGKGEHRACLDAHRPSSSASQTGVLPAGQSDAMAIGVIAPSWAQIPMVLG